MNPALFCKWRKAAPLPVAKIEEPEEVPSVALREDNSIVANWFIPNGNRYTKLPVYSQYAFGKSVVNTDPDKPGSVLIAGLEKLTAHFPWLDEVRDDALHRFGDNLISRFDEAALLFTAKAIEHNWLMHNIKDKLIVSNDSLNDQQITSIFSILSEDTGDASFHFVTISGEEGFISRAVIEMPKLARRIVRDYKLFGDVISSPGYGDMNNSPYGPAAQLHDKCEDIKEAIDEVVASHGKSEYETACARVRSLTSAVFLDAVIKDMRGSKEADIKVDVDEFMRHDYDRKKNPQSYQTKEILDWLTSVSTNLRANPKAHAKDQVSTLFQKLKKLVPDAFYREVLTSYEPVKWAVRLLNESIESQLLEATFSQLFNQTQRNGEYRHGAMRKVRGRWVYDPNVPGRIQNSRFVIQSPPNIQRDDDGMLVIQFRFRSRPVASTTGNVHSGYIKFIEPTGVIKKLIRFIRRPSQINQDIQVYCACQDFKYRWHKVLADIDAAPKPSGLGNKFPTETNPSGNLSLCKHLACCGSTFLQMSQREYKKIQDKVGKDENPNTFAVGVGKPMGVKDGAEVDPKPEDKFMV